MRLYEGRRRPESQEQSYVIEAEIESPNDGSADGVIFAMGNLSGGLSLYLKDGRLKFFYNMLDLEKLDIEAADKLPEGSHLVRVEFDYDGGGVGKGGVATLFIDNKQAAQGRLNSHRAICIFD